MRKTRVKDPNEREMKQKKKKRSGRKGGRIPQKILVAQKQTETGRKISKK